MLSRTAEYALQAMIVLARNAEEEPVSGPRIATAAGVPRKYLSAILADLVRAGLLDGTRGKSGGFQLTRPAKRIRLAQVVAPFEPLTPAKRTCPFGNAVCGDRNPCVAHDRWTEVNAGLSRFLKETTLEDVARARSERAKRGRS
jgi:Rrf2 family protein